MTGKLVAALISPLGTALVLGALGLLLGWLGGRAGRESAARRWGPWLVGVALAWLTLWSMPIVSDTLRGAIEAQAGPRLVEQVPAAPVMVVLGGGVSAPRPPQRPYPDLNAAGDRLWHAARLYRAGKAQKVLLSGGITRKGDTSEADAMRRFLEDMGVPAAAIVLEDGSLDTAGNAQLTARLMKQQGVDRILLVTSAMHMPRARKLFERTGLQVQPAPTDFEVAPMPFDILRFVPSANTLDSSGQAFKEIFGWVAGR